MPAHWTDTPADLLEAVLSALTAAQGDPMHLFTALSANGSHLRVTALICALLRADQILRDTFAGTTNGHSDALLARAAALSLAEAAEEVERARPPEGVLRLSDVTG